jgi:hypothetical protein
MTSTAEGSIQRRRGRPTVFGFLAAMLLLPIGATLAPFGIGIPIFAIGLSLQLDS